MSTERPANSRGALSASGVALLAVAIRLLPIRSVFVEGQTYFTDSDSYYHLRRIVYNLAAFPSTLETDLYLNFPHGAKAIWPQTLDWLLAALLLPFGLADDPVTLERVLVFVPPLLGGVTVFVFHRIAARLFDERLATLAALILALLPAHFWYSQIGFLDHHVAVALCSTWLFGATLGLVARCEQSAQRSTLRAGIGFGCLLAFNLMIWPGALLYVALSVACLLAFAALSREAAASKATLDALGWAGMTATVLIAPMTLGSEWPQWGPYSAVVLSRFQPWLFASLAVHAWLVGRLFARGCAGSLPARVGSMTAVGAAILLVSFIVLPGLGESVRDSVQWLGRSDAFQGLVGESVPLFILHGRFTTQIASSRLSYFVFLVPIAWVWLAVRWRSDVRRSERFVFLAWTLVLFVFTLLQKRFFNTFSMALALLMAVSLTQLVDVLARRLGANARRALVWAAVVLLMLPSLASYVGPLREIVSGLRGLAPEPNPRVEINRVRRELTTWLRDHTPETSGYFDASASPEYGVLARWGEGHFITYVARRPAVVGNFGDDLGREHFLLARSFFGAEPERAAEILEALRVRYVVIRAMNENREMAKRLYRSDGSRLGRYRLVHEVRPMAGGDVPSYKVFEFVKGAEWVGRAPPRALVRAELDLVTSLGRETRYETVAQADGAGRYRLRLPYATGAVAGSVRSASRYRVTVRAASGDATGSLRSELEVDESAVREGARISDLAR